MAGFVLAGVLLAGCVSAPATDDVKTKLVRSIRGTYLYDVDTSGLETLSIPEIMQRLDPNSRIVERGSMSLDFIRGLEPEGAVTLLDESDRPDACLRVAFFGRWTVPDAERALRGIPPERPLTIDLRDNGGGSVQAAFQLAERFVPAGTKLAMYEDRRGRVLHVATRSEPPDRRALMIVVNERTASSAELFAAILASLGRARLAGSPTAGKLTVQGAMRLDGSHLLYLTIGRLLAPDGRPFGERGHLVPERPSVAAARPCERGAVRAG